MIRDRLQGLISDGDEEEDEEDSSPQSHNSYTDEQFLNEIRKADRPFLKTAKVADGRGVHQRTAQKRLKQLEKEDRVESEKIGQAKLWWLDESEPQEPVKEDGAQLLRLSNRLEGFTRGLGYAAVGLFGMSGFLLLVYLTASAQDIVLPYFGKQGATFGALLIALSAGIGGALWALAKGACILLRTALRRGWVGTVGT